MQCAPLLTGSRETYADLTLLVTYFCYDLMNFRDLFCYLSCLDNYLLSNIFLYLNYYSSHIMYDFQDCLF